MVVETDRLILRRWKSSDVEPFVSLNADPRVMEFFPATLSRSETEAMISQIAERIRQQGLGLWAADVKVTNGFIGFIGLNVPGATCPRESNGFAGIRLGASFLGREAKLNSTDY